MVALQFHPELDAELLELWIANDGTDDLGRLGMDPDTLRAATAAHADAALDRLRTLVAGFLGRLGR